jgi:diguanylate cyclase (GGDEF)-like protein
MSGSVNRRLPAHLAAILPDARRPDVQRTLRAVALRVRRRVRVARQRLGYIRHASVYFGVPLILFVWVAALGHIAQERMAARRAVVEDTATLTRVLEENVIRTVGEVDRALKFLRASFEHGGTPSAWQGLLADAYLVSDLMLQTAVIDAQGNLIATNLSGGGAISGEAARQPKQRVNLADRPHFKVHADNQNADVLYVSEPVLGRVSGKWSVQLTRRFTTKDGKFGGVLVASLDPKQLSRMHDSIDVGTDASVAIAGLDGIVRVASGASGPKMGHDLSRSPAFDALKSTPHGSYLVPIAAPLSAASVLQLDATQEPAAEASEMLNATQSAAVARVVSFRRVRNYPLVVLVSAADRQQDSSYVRNRIRYLLLASSLTVMALAGIFLGLRHEQRLALARRDLARSEARARTKSRDLELTFAHMNQGIMMVDAAGEVAFINAQAGRLLDLPDELIARRAHYRDLVGYLKDRQDFAGPGRTLEPHILEYIEESTERPPLPLYERVRPNGMVIEFRSEALPDGGFVRTLTDVTLRHRSAAQISHLARHDVLTNLANRRLFHEHLEEARAGLADGMPFAILSIDLDRFKNANDTLGHPVGDKLLQIVARRLTETVRDSDVVARMGGDEFMIIQRHVSRDDQAASLAKRVIKAMAKPFEIDQHMIEIGASIGIAMASEPDIRSDDLIQAADLALYSAKTSGRGTFRFFEPSLHETVHKRRIMELSLRTALKQRQFCLFYQPIQDFKSGQVTSFEALLRWQHPERGTVSPAEFIPIAEEMGLIVQIGAWALHAATAEAARWPSDIRVSVNLSAVQFRSPGLVAMVKSALQRSGLDASRLDLEITESTLMARDKSTLDQLHELRALGVHISMDDFGTGYSSLSYLLSFPFDKIKIDRAFISELGNHKGSSAIIQATIDLAANLGMTTTAEGVETHDQFNRLKGLGCTEAQGYLLSRPRPKEDVPVMLLMSCLPIVAPLDEPVADVAAA